MLVLLYESFKIALGAISANKMRSILTTLGIIIGVAAVIAAVSIVQGLSYLVNNRLAELGADFILVVPHRPPGEEGLKLGRIKLTYEDGLAILEEATAIRDYCPIVQRTVLVKYGEEHAATTVTAATSSYQDINVHYVDEGRFLSRIDVKHRKRVCVVGRKVLENLGIKSDPIGKQIIVGKDSFTIIGIMEKKGQALGKDADDLVIIPYTLASNLFGRRVLDQTILAFKASSVSLVDLAKDQITRILRKRHGLRKDQPDDFQVILQSDMLKGVSSILGGVTATVAGIVGISLLVGGIGIMNIMLVSVTERTREIGIRKAVGAKRRDILLQFLIEAIALSLVGGAIGVLFGFGLGRLVTSLISVLPQAHVPVWAIFLGFGFSTAVGLFFGIYPAAKASRLDPIEALRYE